MRMSPKTNRWTQISHQAGRCACSLLFSTVLFPQTSGATNITIYFTDKPLKVDSSAPVGTILRTDEKLINPPEEISRSDCASYRYTIDDLGQGQGYSTGIEGLTMRAYWRFTMATQKIPLAHSGTYIRLASGNCKMRPGFLVVEWVKAGNIQPPQNPPFIRVVTARIKTIGARPISAVPWTLLVYGPSVNASTPPTCKPSADSFRVPMAPTSIRRFTGIGSTSDETRFELFLTCTAGDAGTQVKARVTLADSVTPSNNSDRLTLTDNSIARGVGVQVLKDGRPLYFGTNAPGNPWSVGQIQGGVSPSILRIPLTARYVQTAAIVTPGSPANARATVTFDYE